MRCVVTTIPGHFAPQPVRMNSDRIVVTAIESPAPMGASDLADVLGIDWPSAKVLDAHPASRNDGRWESILPVAPSILLKFPIVGMSQLAKLIKLHGVFG